MRTVSHAIFPAAHGGTLCPSGRPALFENSKAVQMAMAVSAQLVNLSAKAELKLVEAVASSMPSGQVRPFTHLIRESSK